MAKADGAPIAASWVSSQFGKLLDAYHDAVGKAEPPKAKEAEPKKAKGKAKKKSTDLEV